MAHRDKKPKRPVTPQERAGDIADREAELFYQEHGHGFFDTLSEVYQQALLELSTPA